jgi:hypothetical protein
LADRRFGTGEGGKPEVPSGEAAEVFSRSSGLQITTIYTRESSFLHLQLSYSSIFLSPLILSPLSLSHTLAMAAAPTSTGSTAIEAIKQVASPEEPKKLSGVALYSRFAFAGAVCCSITHGGLTPVDV